MNDAKIIAITQLEEDFLNSTLKERLAHETGCGCSDKRLAREEIERLENLVTELENKLTCPVCNKSMSQGLYNRWGHGENCKGK